MEAEQGSRVTERMPDGPAVSGVEPPNPGRPVGRRVLTQAALLAVGTGAGLLFAVTGRVNRDRGSSRDEGGLKGLLRERQDRAQSLSDEISEKRALRDELEASEPSANVPGLTEAEELAGLTEVEGPGIRVTLTDAPPSSASREGVGPNDLVVHQQDLESYVNALWAGGAEAMMMQDQRVISSSAFRCVGNTLLLQGRVYSPPFVVTAIGDPTRLRAALDAAKGVEWYRQWVTYVGLGESIETLASVTLPAYEGSVNLARAEVARGEHQHRP